MPRSAPLQSNFLGGEWSPYAQGDVQNPLYHRSVDTMLNFLPMLQGGVTRRPGTKFIAELKSSSNAARLIKYELSIPQGFMLEVGPGYIRFFKNNAPILLAGVPYEIGTSYLTIASIKKIRVAQNESDLYFAHPTIPLKKLTRLSDTSWTLTTVPLIDGPFLDGVDKTDNAMNFGNLGGGVYSIAITNGTGVNGGAGFVATDVGRLVRAKQIIAGATTWQRLVITSYVNPLLVHGIPQLGAGPSATVGVTYEFRLGVYSDTTGYPGVITFHEGRMFLTGCASVPQRIDASTSGALETFSTTEFDGTVTTSNAIAAILRTGEMNAFRWLKSDERALLGGSINNEWTIRPSVLSEAMSSTNFDAKPATYFGSADVDPIRLGKGILFAQRSTKKIRELGYSFDANAGVSGAYRAPNRTKYAEHITGATGILEMAFQREPQSIVWAVRNDGTLIGMTHEDEDGAITFGWHRHVMGGPGFGAPGTVPKVDSVATIPSTDGTRDEVWVIVQRKIGGFLKRYIEVIQPIFSVTDALEDAVFLDCAKTYLILGGPGTLITGLTHLVGETVQVLADGAPQGDFVVNGSGEITLLASATKVVVGYEYQSDLRLLRFESGSADGTALGKLRRTHWLGVLFQQTLGVSAGTDFTKLDGFEFRDVNVPMGYPTPLFSGIKPISPEADMDFDDKLCFRATGPYPAAILAIMPRMDTEDAA